MANDFLSQDEVDALLEGVADDEEPLNPEVPDGGARPYSLGKQERIVRGRMPALEIINDRFARLLKSGLFNFVRRSPEISVGPVKLVQYSEFVRNLTVPTNLNVARMRPLRGSCLFVFDPSLVFAVVDNMFGGDGRFQTRGEGRDFTPTEQRIIRKLLEVVFDGLQKSWASVHPLAFEYVRSESHTQFASIATPSEIVVTSTFNIELGDAGGQLQICIPYSAIEPIRDALDAPNRGDSPGPDERWMRMLSTQVQLAEVELVAQFAKIPATLERVMQMKVGDVLDLEAPRAVQAAVDGVPVFECKYGSQNGHYALRVERVLAVRPQDNQPGG